MSTPISGLASGFDWSTMVDQLAEVERAPQKQLLAQQTVIEEHNNALGSLKTQLGVLRNRLATLMDSSLFDSRTAASSDATHGTAVAASGAAVGQYTFAISQLATASKLAGTSGVGQRLSETADVSGLTLSSAGFATAVTAGVFTVNGKPVTVTADDTLGGVFDKIAEATGNAVSAAYDPVTDGITLTSADPIILGSATDTSNFLTVAKLYDNNATSISSRAELGAVRRSGTLDAANFATPLTGGSAGSFSINGVAISYDTGVDSLATVLDRINTSSAGVLASYDTVNDRFTLTNKSTGAVGIAMEDTSGNFLAAAGLLSGSLTVGKNLEYTVNGGGALSSHSNTITEASSGLTGLSVTALAEETFTVTVGVDTARIRSAIQGFATEYNRSQADITTLTASSTDSKGKVTAGTLADDSTVAQLGRELRALVSGTLEGLSGSINRLDALGFSTNGYDDTLATSDLSGLDEALLNDPAGLKEFFADSTHGLAVTLDNYLEAAIGDDGSITAHQNTLTKESASIDVQVADMETLVQANRDQMIASFVAMEQAQASINQQLTYLLKQFSSSS